eukprot:927849-Amorphochlora_amoeboformis.AAC.1
MGPRPKNKVRCASSRFDKFKIDTCSLRILGCRIPANPVFRAESRRSDGSRVRLESPPVCTVITRFGDIPTWGVGRCTS